MSKRTEIRITGYGGQGVVLSGYIIGRAFAINASKHATMIQSFGPEARGSACSTTLVLSEDEVLYPYITKPDIFVVMSKEGYDKFGESLRDGGVIIYGEDLVTPKKNDKFNYFGVPSTRIAEEIGRSIVQNIVMLGFYSAVTKFVDKESMRQAVTDSVPPGTEKLNLQAFDAGWDHFETAYGAGDKKKPAEAAEATA